MPRRLGVLVVLACALAACSGDSTSSTTSSTSSSTTSTTIRSTRQPQTGAKPQGVEDLKLGDCYDPAPDEAQRTIIALLVDCAGPHKYEVYAAPTYNEPGKSSPAAEYPGDSDLRNFAEERCYEQFRPFVGRKWSSSRLDMETWYPTAGSWYRERDRNILCVLADRDFADLIGTARNLNE